MSRVQIFESGIPNNNVKHVLLSSSEYYCFSLRFVLVDPWKGVTEGSLDSSIFIVTSVRADALGTVFDSRQGQKFYFSPQITGIKWVLRNI